ncbi:Hypothetical predicted protein [Paramuricea clavata]|nr:Hypothetical predicted protein [Paramuricea clavata]
MASQNFVLKLSVLALATCVAQGFFLGSEKEGTFIPFEKLKDLGLSRDHKVYSHLVIPPWSRPFKLGYCESWEWHTDPKYRAQRLAICKELSEGTHECDSPTGFCDDKCPYTNASYPFWRLRNSAEVQIVWTVSSIQMFSSSSSNKNLIENPTKAYASSYFGPGYYPSNAFDNNPETIWVSNGQAPPGMQWLAFEFDHPVSIGSIRIASEIDKPERAPTEIYVEGSCEKYFRTFETMWVIRNPMQKSDIRAHGELKRRDAGKPRFRRFR